MAFYIFGKSLPHNNFTTFSFPENTTRQSYFNELFLLAIEDFVLGGIKNLKKIPASKVYELADIHKNLNNPIMPNRYEGRSLSFFRYTKETVDAVIKIFAQAVQSIPDSVVEDVKKKFFMEKMRDDVFKIHQGPDSKYQDLLLRDGQRQLESYILSLYDIFNAVCGITLIKIYEDNFPLRLQVAFNTFMQRKTITIIENIILGKISKGSNLNGFLFYKVANNQRFKYSLMIDKAFLRLCYVKMIQ